MKTFFWYIRKFFFIFRKKSAKSGKIFEMTSPPSPIFAGKKFLDAFFYSKGAPQSLAPPNF
jgi:hypothetical protein